MSYSPGPRRTTPKKLAAKYGAPYSTPGQKNALPTIPSSITNEEPELPDQQLKSEFDLDHPLRVEDLPAINPFTNSPKPDDQLEEVSTTIWPDRVPVARDTKLFDNTAEKLYNEHEQLYCRGAVIYFRAHQVTNEDMRNRVFGEQIEPMSEKFLLARNALRENINNWQRRITAFIINGIKNLVKVMGKERFQAANARDQLKIFEHLWDREPAVMARTMLNSLCKYVNVRGIYKGFPSEMKKWRDFIRMQFLWCCLKAVKHVALETPPKPELVREEWQKSPRRKEMDELDLGWDYGSVPVHAGGFVDHQRRREHSFVKKLDKDLSGYVSTSGR